MPVLTQYAPEGQNMSLAQNPLFRFVVELSYKLLFAVDSWICRNIVVFDADLF